MLDIYRAAAKSYTAITLPASTLDSYGRSLIHSNVESADHQPYGRGAATISRCSIRLAETRHDRHRANSIVSKMYGWRGYSVEERTYIQPDAVTLGAFNHGEMFGTITVRFESAQALSVESLYADEVAQLRAKGARLCEFGKLAIDRSEHSLESIATMFHAAYIFARRIRGATDLLIEVNPRHAGFYKRMLGFEQLGPQRICERVNAPAVLLRLRLEHAERQIEIFGGLGKTAEGTRSLYPWFLGPKEEQAVIDRYQALMGMRGARQ